MLETPSLSAIAALLLLMLGAPIVPGIASRTKSVLTGRRGSPVWQLYADLWKLARRGIVYSTTTTWVFRLAPIVLVATTLAATMLVPLDGRASLLAFSGDVVAFAYLLGLGRFALVLAALDTGSSFEGMGASREVTFAALVEPGIFVGLTTRGVLAHEFSLTAMLGAAQPRPGFATAGPSYVMVGLSLFALALAECSRIPVDDPTTHLELTMVHEVMVLDHSGPDLAMILYASALKLGDHRQRVRSGRARERVVGTRRAIGQLRPRPGRDRRRRIADGASPLAQGAFVHRRRVGACRVRPHTGSQMMHPAVTLRPWFS